MIHWHFEKQTHYDSKWGFKLMSKHLQRKKGFKVPRFQNLHQFLIQSLPLWQYMDNPYNNLSVVSLIEHWELRETLWQQWGFKLMSKHLQRKLGSFQTPMWHVLQANESMSKKEHNLLTFAQILINLSPCFIPADHRVAMAERTNSPFALAFTQIQECIGNTKFLDIKSKLWIPAL